MSIRHKSSYFVAAALPVLVALIALPNPLAQQSRVNLGGADPVQAPALCKNKIQFEPVVTYDVSGSTFGGPFHQHLTVYNNGVASLARLSTFSGTGVSTAQVPLADVLQLKMDLDTLGARSLCDISAVVSDVPLNTVTVFSGSTDARAHTFSFFLAIKQQGAVKQLLETFIATHFDNM